MEEPSRDLSERTFDFARRVVKLCQSLDQTPGVSRTLANQLLRPGTSIGANVAEGQASQSRADFIAMTHKTTIREFFHPSLFSLHP